MSFYNMIHGENKDADVLLALLGITRADVPRYRDCYWNGEEIAVYTRTGGGNREDYAAENDALTKLPTYLRDEDDDYDSTYATFYFSVSEELKPAVAHLKASDATPEQRWESFLNKLRSPESKDDPQVKRVMNAMTPLFEQLAGKIKEAK